MVCFHIWRNKLNMMLSQMKVSLVLYAWN